MLYNHIKFKGVGIICVNSDVLIVGQRQLRTEIDLQVILRVTGDIMLRDALEWRAKNAVE